MVRHIFYIFAPTLNQDSTYIYNDYQKTEVNPSDSFIVSRQNRPVLSAADTIVQGSANNDLTDSVNLKNILEAPPAFVQRDNAIRHDGRPLPFVLEQTDGIFALLLICFLVFSHIGGLGFLRNNMSHLFSYEKSLRIQREANIKEVLFSYFLILQTVILVSICLYDIFLEYQPSPDIGSPLISILSFVVVIGVFLILKSVLYQFIGYVFDLKGIARLWVRSYFVIIQILGIFYFIPTLLLVYGGYWHTQIFIFMAILFIIAQIVLFCRIIIFFIREKFNFLFLIVYLCSVEIIPYLFLGGTLFFIYKKDILNILWQ